MARASPSSPTQSPESSATQAKPNRHHAAAAAKAGSHAGKLAEPAECLQPFNLPFHCPEANETPIVDQAPAPALDSAEKVEDNANSAEEADMDISPMPPSTPPTPHQVSGDEEPVARRHACRERDARQSLALSETGFPPLKTSTRRKKIRDKSTTAMPAETMLECESPDSRDIDIDISISSTRESSNSLQSPSSSKQPLGRGVWRWGSAEEAQLAEFAGLVESLQTKTR